MLQRINEAPGAATQGGGGGFAAGASSRAPLYSRAMSEGKDRTGKEAADLEDLAKRFQDLWQEQMAATAADPEFMEMMGKWMGAFTAGGMSPPGTSMPGMAPAGLAGMPGPMDPAAWMAALQAAMTGAATAGKGRTDDRSASPPATGAKAAADASGAGDVAGDRLERRLAALEQRLERLEAALGKPGGGTAKRTRRRKS